MHFVRTRAFWLTMGAIVLVLFGLLIAAHIEAPAILGFDDFVAYWAVGRLALSGRNPYDVALIQEMQATVGWPHDWALVVWNPPWALGFTMAAGAFPYHTARLLWFGLHFTIIAACSQWLWRYYWGGTGPAIGIAIVVFAFLPALFVLKIGNITPLTLIGLVGFLHFSDKGRQGCAGVCLALTLIKPHLFYLVWAIVGLQALRRRQPALVLGAALGVGVGMAVAVAAVPSAMGDFVRVWAHSAPAEWVTPTLGSLLRLALGWHCVGLQLAPSFLALIALVVYWRGKCEWSWRSELPLLVALSFASTPWGWGTDGVLLLLPLLHALGSLRNLNRGRQYALVAAYVLINLMTASLWPLPALVYNSATDQRLPLSFFLRPSILWQIPVTWMWVALYIVARKWGSLGRANAAGAVPQAPAVTLPTDS